MEKIYNKGDIIIKQGDNSNKNLFILKKGTLVVQRAVNGTIIDCGYMRAGDIFGEISMILNMERAASIMSKEDGTVVEELNRITFLEAVRKDPEIAWKILSNLAIRTQTLNEIQGQIADPKTLRKILFGV